MYIIQYMYIILYINIWVEDFMEHVRQLSEIPLEI